MLVAALGGDAHRTNGGDMVLMAPKLVGQERIAFRQAVLLARLLDATGRHLDGRGHGERQDVQTSAWPLHKIQHVTSGRLAGYINVLAKLQLSPKANIAGEPLPD